MDAISLLLSYMSDFIQERPAGSSAEAVPGGPDGSEQQSLAWPDEPLVQLPESKETEAGVIKAALETLADLPTPEEDADIDPQNPWHVVGQGVTALITQLNRLQKQAGHESDPYQTFRDMHNTASPYNQAITAFLSVIDEYTERWGYGGRMGFRTGEHQAAESTVTRLLGIMAENFDHIAFGVETGKPVDLAYMHVEKLIPSLDKPQIGCVARMAHLGFRNNRGDVVRPADVDQYEHTDKLPAE